MFPLTATFLTASLLTAIGWASTTPYTPHEAGAALDTPRRPREVGWAPARPHWPQTPRDSSDCKCFPGDSCWPTAKEWNKLNKTVDGRLVATVPLGSPCYKESQWDTYDDETCSTLQELWTKPDTHIDTSSSVMAPLFANQSCDPFYADTLPCVLGTYVQYAIDVATPKHVQAGLKFAEKHNIRLVIRNTGHDYNGKSTGAGALSVWMHHLKDIEVIDYSDSHYSGKALKMGAGVEGLEAYVAADKAGLHVVGGTCPSVGIAGGYSQGGGHSPLASRHGLGADQILEWEVVTAEGKHLIASRKKNSDLYWAMSGGGGGVYAVALSVKYKAYQDIPFSGFTLNYLTANTTLDAHYEVINYLHAMIPGLTEKAISVVWYFEEEYLTISPITAPEISSEQLKEYLKPLEDKIASLGIKYESTYTDFAGFLPYYNGTANPDQPIDVGIAQYGGRLIPTEILQDEQKNQDLTNAFRKINKEGGQFIGVGLNVSKAVAGDVDNAVLPAWRTASIATVLTTPWNFTAPWSEMIDLAALMTDVLLPAIDEVVPSPSCYLNEGDFQERDWKSIFYGANYDELLRIKNKYDPKHLFYATTGVDNDYYTVAEDRRLCRA